MKWFERFSEPTSTDFQLGNAAQQNGYGRKAQEEAQTSPSGTDEGVESECIGVFVDSNIQGGVVPQHQSRPINDPNQRMIIFRH